MCQGFNHVFGFFRIIFYRPNVPPAAQGLTHFFLFDYHILPLPQFFHNIISNMCNLFLQKRIPIYLI